MNADMDSSITPKASGNKKSLVLYRKLRDNDILIDCYGS